MGKLHAVEELSEVEDFFGSVVARNEFRFSRACGHSKLEFAFEGNNAAQEENDESRGRSSAFNVTSIIRVRVCNDVPGVGDSRKLGVNCRVK